MKNAVTIYLNKNRKTARTIRYIKEWRAKAGIKENADILGIEIGYAYKLSRDYGLPFEGMYRDG